MAKCERTTAVGDRVPTLLANQHVETNEDRIDYDTPHCGFDPTQKMNIYTFARNAQAIPFCYLSLLQGHTAMCPYNSTCFNK
jgi:hypothetical protein